MNPETLRSLLVVAGHTAVIYLFLMFLLRLLGRRLMGQLHVLDLVIIIVLGSAVETAMVNGDTSLPAGLVSASTLLLLNRLFSRVLLRTKRLRGLLLGGPMLLVHEGEFVEKNLHRTGLTQEDVREGCRERGVSDLGRIRYAVMEEDGTISVLQKEAPIHRTAEKARSVPLTPDS